MFVVLKQKQPRIDHGTWPLKVRQRRNKTGHNTWPGAAIVIVTQPDVRPAGTVGSQTYLNRLQKQIWTVVSYPIGGPCAVIGTEGSVTEKTRYVSNLLD